MSTSAAPQSGSAHSDMRRTGILKNSTPPKPSPSSEDEYDSPPSHAANFHQSRVHNRGSSQTHRASISDDHEVTANDSWFDFPLAFALLPAAGSILTGSDLLKDFMLMSLLIYYLHTLIKVPWELYSLARARRAPSHDYANYLRSQDTHDDQARELARSELRLAELVYLSFTLVAPFLGAVLLRYVSQLLSIDVVSTFSTSVFVLATGIRPWRHLVNLLRNRTENLQNVIHLPDDASLTRRIDRLEADFRQQLAAKLDLASVKADVRQAVDDALEHLSRKEKKAEAEKLSLEARILSLESALVEVKATALPPTSVGRHIPGVHHIQVGLGTGIRSRHHNMIEPTTVTITLPLPSRIVPQMQQAFEWIASLLPGGQPSLPKRTRSRRRSVDTAAVGWPALGDIYEVDGENGSDGEKCSALLTGNNELRSSASAGINPDGTDDFNQKHNDSRFTSAFAYVLLWPVRLMRRCAEWVAGSILTGGR